MNMSPRLLRPRATGFNPKSVPSLFVWWDFSDSSTVTLSGASITAVSDKSGNARSASQVSANNQPVISTAARNGLNAAQFDGMDDALDASVGSTQFTSITAFCVTIADAAGGGSLGRIYERDNQGSTWSRNNANAAQNFLMPWSSATGNGQQRSAASSFPLSTWLLLAVRYTGGSVTETDCQPRINRASSTAGLAGTRDSFATNQSTTFTVGNRSLASGYDRGWNGKIGELLIYNASLTDAQVAAVEGYLSKKWAL